MWKIAVARLFIAVGTATFLAGIFLFSVNLLVMLIGVIVAELALIAHGALTNTERD